MPLDQVTLRRLLQSRPELAQLLVQPTQATAPTAPGGFMPESLTRVPLPADILSGQGGQDWLAEPADDAGFASGLWNRVKGLFDPDEEADPAQQRYDQDVSGAGWAGAAQAAAEASANPQLSPIQVLTQALAGYSGAKQRAKQGLRGEAREERLFGLKERELEAEIGAGEAKRAQQQALLDEIGKIEDPEQRRIAMLDPGAYAAQAAKRLFPEAQNLIEVEGGGIFDPNERRFIVEPRVKPTAPFGSDALGYFQIDPQTGQPVQVVGGLGRAGEKAQIFGNETLGYYTLGPDGKPSQLVGGLGRPPTAGAETFTTLTPEESKALGYPAGVVVQRSSRGELKEFSPPAGAGGEPLEPVLTDKGVRLFPRSQAAFMQPAPKQEGGSETERLDAELLQMANRARKDDGFQNFSAEEQARYTRKFLRASEPRYDAAGNEIRPFVQDLPLPPDITAAPIAPPVQLPAPLPGAPPPGLPMVDQGAPPGAAGMTTGPIRPPVAGPPPIAAAVQAAPAAAAAAPAGLRYPEPGGIRPVTNTAAARQKISAIRTARSSLEAAITDYRTIVEKAGGKILPGSPAATALNAARTRVKLRAKDVYELGALTGPDESLMDDLVPGATGFGGLGDTLGRVNAGLAQLTRDLDAQLAATIEGYGAPGAAAPAPAAAAPASAAAGAKPPAPDDDAARSQAIFGY